MNVPPGIQTISISWTEGFIEVVVDGIVLVVVEKGIVVVVAFGIAFFGIEVVVLVVEEELVVEICGGFREDLKRGSIRISPIIKATPIPHHLKAAILLSLCGLFLLGYPLLFQALFLPLLLPPFFL